jgi:hypothetical protein
MYKIKIQTLPNGFMVTLYNKYLGLIWMHHESKHFTKQDKNEVFSYVNYLQDAYNIPYTDFEIISSGLINATVNAKLIQNE